MKIIKNLKIVIFLFIQTFSLKYNNKQTIPIGIPSHSYSPLKISESSKYDSSLRRQYIPNTYPQPVLNSYQTDNRFPNIYETPPDLYNTNNFPRQELHPLQHEYKIETSYPPSNMINIRPDERNMYVFTPEASNKPELSLKNSPITESPPPESNVQQIEPDTNQQTELNEDSYTKKYHKAMKKLKKYKEEAKTLKEELETIKGNQVNSQKNIIQASFKRRNKIINENIVRVSTSNGKNTTKITTQSDWINQVLKEKLLILNGLDLKINESTISLLSNRDLNSRENLIRIDKKLIISKTHPSADKLCQKVAAIPEFEHNFQKICLPLVLLSDNKIDSNLMKYFNKDYLLADKYRNFPVFFKDKELKILKGSYFNSLIKARNHLFEQEYDILVHSKIIKKSNIDFKEYMKARIFTISRNMQITNKQNETLSVLIPIMDQLNNYKREGNTIFDYSNSMIFLNLTRNIKKEEEILLNIPNMSNDHLLLYYGYTKENNQLKSEVYLDLKISKVVKQLGSNLTHEESSESILLNQEYNIIKLISDFKRIVFPQEAKSFDQEEICLSLLKKSLKATTAKYATNYQSDQVILQNNKNLTENEVNIYRVIVEEKKRVAVYLNIISFFERIFRLVKAGKVVNESLLRKIAVKKTYHSYYETIKDILKDKRESLKLQAVDSTAVVRLTNSNSNSTNISRVLSNSTSPLDMTMKSKVYDLQDNSDEVSELDDSNEEIEDEYQ